MGTLLKKLDSKANNNMVIFNMPPEFEPVERNLHKDIHIYKSNTAIKTEFILIFIKTMGSKISMCFTDKKQKSKLKFFWIQIPSQKMKAPLWQA